MKGFSNNHLSSLIYHFLKVLKVKTSLSKVALVLETHPDFPSMWAISQTLKYFGVKSDAFNANYDGLQKIDKKALIHLNKDGGVFVILESVLENTIIYYDAKIDKHVSITKGEFLKVWSGKVLVVQDCDGVISKSKTKLGFIVVLSFLLILFRATYIADFSFVLFLLNIVGFSLSLILLYNNLGYSNSIISKFCKPFNSFDCKKVNDTPLPSVFRKISLTEVSFIFFFVGAIIFSLMPLFSIKDELLSVIQVVTWAGIFVIVFSLLYQKIVIKKWCLYCLLIALVFVIQFIMFSFKGKEIVLKAELFDALFVVLFFAFISFGVFRGIKTLLVQKFIVEKNIKKNLRLKRIPGVIASLFSLQPYLKLNYGLFHWGNPESNIEITTILSPYCKYCRETFLLMLDLLEMYPDKLKWKIYFEGVVSEKVENINKIPLYFTSFCTKAEELQKEVIKNWYEKKSLNYLEDKYGAHNIDNEIVSRFNISLSKLENYNLDGLPYILINNIKLPEQYSIQDVFYLLIDDEMFMNILNIHPQFKRVCNENSII